ncbi:MAG: hypothetical protein ACRD32_05920 [Nitrososphaerales archaeon]
MPTAKVRSNWWYLLPIFFSLVGGVIAYFAIKNDDPKKARNCLAIGIILTAIGVVLTIITATFVPGIGTWPPSPSV